MEGKNIAYVALAGIGAYAAYKFLSKPKPVEPGLVGKVSVNYRGPQPGSLITWDNKIVAEITWTNQGQSDIAPGFKLSMKPAYSLHTPIGDESTRSWTTSPTVKPGQSITLTADSPVIPIDWKSMIYVPPFTIEMRLLLNDGGSGFLWDNKIVSISDTSMKIENLDTTPGEDSGLVVAPGYSINGTVSFRYTGPAKTLSLHYGLGIYDWFKMWTTEPTIPVKQFGMSLPAGTDLLITKQFAFPIPSTAVQKGYDSMAVMYDEPTELSDTRDINVGAVTVTSGTSEESKYNIGDYLQLSGAGIYLIIDIVVLEGELWYVLDEGTGSFSVKVIVVDSSSLWHKAEISVPWIEVQQPIRGEVVAGSNFVLNFLFDYKGPQATLKWTYELGAIGIWPWPAFTPEPDLYWSASMGVGPNSTTGRYGTGDITLSMPYPTRKTYDALIRIFSNGIQIKSDTDADAITVR